MAHQMMVQQTGKTFRDWANIREPPISDYPSIQGESHAMVNALTNAIKLQDFEDVDENQRRGQDFPKGSPNSAPQR
jgi:hypothetical protein